MASDTPRLVIDTNVALDLLVFGAPAHAPLLADLQQGAAIWLATAAMRDELARVLGYRQLVRCLQARALHPQQVLDRFSAWSCAVPAAARAPVRCRDPDDQIFIDLAVEHRAELLSKDALVLRLARRLAALGVVVAPQRAVGSAAESGQQAAA